MAPSIVQFKPRPMEEVRAELLGWAKKMRNPFLYSVYEEVEPVINRLRSVDREGWSQAFSALAGPYEEKAAKAEAAGDGGTAMNCYLIAYDYHHLARYPAPNSPGKLKAYRQSQENYLRAARYFEPPLERVEMPFRGRPGEGTVSVGYLRKPKSLEKPPVMILWGGIDAFKEERKSEPFLEAGIATLSIDMPGVADAPLAGSEDGERLWDAVLDWIDERADLDSRRVGILGGSTGGYWATKVAHTHRERIRAAVNQGGPAHFAFASDWIAKAQSGEYPFELAETMASAFGRSSAQEWVEYSPRLSLLDQGILDRPCAPPSLSRRTGRQCLSHRRHVSAARSWRPQVRPLISRRPHGGKAGTLGHPPLADPAFGLKNGLYGADGTRKNTKKLHLSQSMS